MQEEHSGDLTVVRCRSAVVSRARSTACPPCSKARQGLLSKLGDRVDLVDATARVIYIHLHPNHPHRGTSGPSRFPSGLFSLSTKPRPRSISRWPSLAGIAPRLTRTAPAGPDRVWKPWNPA